MGGSCTALSNEKSQGRRVQSLNRRGRPVSLQMEWQEKKSDTTGTPSTRRMDVRSLENDGPLSYGQFRREALGTVKSRKVGLPEEEKREDTITLDEGKRKKERDLGQGETNVQDGWEKSVGIGNIKKTLREEMGRWHHAKTRRRVAT